MFQSDTTKLKKHNSWHQGAGWGALHDEEYGAVFYKRAIGELPEMESSKAIAKRLLPFLLEGISLLDVGCGVGHYLRSLKSLIPTSFRYFGVDITELYITLANKAFSNEPNVKFQVADIFELPFENKEFNGVMCNNVLLHLPRIVKPIQELCRVAEKFILIRMLIGERSFLIREVRNEGVEFDTNGEPVAYNYYNIYSKRYIEHILNSIPRIKSFKIVVDKDFDPKKIDASISDQPKAKNVTRMCGDWQVNGYVMQPWCFIEIELYP